MPFLKFGENERLYWKFVSATPLKPINTISWNYVVMKGIMWRCAYPQENLIQFFSQSYAFLNSEIWLKWNILLKQFVSATPLKPLNIITWNFVVIKDIMCRCPYPQEILMQFLFRVYWTFWTWKFGPNDKYYWNSLSAQLLLNRSTEILETL